MFRCNKRQLHPRYHGGIAAASPRSQSCCIVHCETEATSTYYLVFLFCPLRSAKSDFNSCRKWSGLLDMVLSLVLKTWQMYSVLGWTWYLENTRLRKAANDCRFKKHTKRGQSFIKLKGRITMRHGVEMAIGWTPASDRGSTARCLDTTDVFSPPATPPATPLRLMAAWRRALTLGEQ